MFGSHALLHPFCLLVYSNTFSLPTKEVVYLAGYLDYRGFT
jgi:hypothetical protein